MFLCLLGKETLLFTVDFVGDSLLLGNGEGGEDKGHNCHVKQCCEAKVLASCTSSQRSKVDPKRSFKKDSVE